MSIHTVISAKAMTPQTRSDSVIVTFNAKWHDSLRQARFTAVIRKRVPLSITPNWMYFHINAPISAICARARVSEVSTISRAKALSMSAKLDLPEKTILHYLGDRKEIGCYTLKSIQFPVKEIKTLDLSQRIVYHPPQSFLILSKDGKQTIDQLCGFRNGVSSL